MAVSKEFFKTVNVVAEEKGLTKEQVLDAFTQGMIAGCKKAHDVRSCVVELNEEKNSIIVKTEKLVVESYSLDADKNYTQILLEDAREINKRVKVGDVLRQEINPKDFGLYADRKSTRLNSSHVRISYAVFCLKKKKKKKKK